jgi:hypothetical protein
MAIEYSKMKVTELKDALKAKGLPSVGSKAEMAKRLEKHQEGMVDAENDILDATNTDEEAVTKTEEDIEIEKETEASPEITEVIKKAETVESETKAAEKKKPTEMTNEERLRMRAERFGLSQPPAGGQEVGGLVKRRQERFSEEPKAKKLAPEVVAEPKEMDEKMKARLERFKMK